MCEIWKLKEDIKKERGSKASMALREMLGVTHSYFILFVIVILSLVSLGENTDEFGRDDFPKSFAFGAGTSAYQVVLSLYINAWLIVYLSCS